MSNPSLDSSRLPLEVLLPVSASLLISLAMTAYFAHRIRQKRLSRSKQFASSPSVLVLSDPETNRQWLLDLSRLKDLGLDQMRKAKRACSLSLDVKRRSLGKADADPTFFGLPTRPRNIFLPGGRSRSSPRAVVRQSWVQNLLYSSYDRLIGSRSCAANDAKITPEIRITVPSMAANDATALPQDRRWSHIIARDIDLSLRDISKPEASDASASRASDRSSHRNSRHPQHPPNSMDTLPSPARRRLSCAASAESSPKQLVALHNQFRTLSPIKETCESLNVYNSSSLCSVNEVADANFDDSALPSKSPEDQDALMLSYGQALLNTSISLRSMNTGSSDTQISRNSSYSEGADGFASGSQDHAMLADQQSETQQAFPAEPIQESQTAFSLVGAYDSGHITLSDMSVDSPSVPMTWTPQARRFFVCNPDTSLPCSSSAASLHISTLDSDQRPYPLPLIPSAFVDSTTPRLSSQVPASPVSVLESNGSGSLAISCSTNREKSQRLSRSSAGVELWVDEDADLFYCPGPVDSRA